MRPSQISLGSHVFNFSHKLAEAVDYDSDNHGNRHARSEHDRRLLTGYAGVLIAGQMGLLEQPDLASTIRGASFNVFQRLVLNITTRITGVPMYEVEFSQTEVDLNVGLVELDIAESSGAAIFVGSRVLDEDSRLLNGDKDRAKSLQELASRLDALGNSVIANEFSPVKVLRAGEDLMGEIAHTEIGLRGLVGINRAVHNVCGSRGYLVSPLVTKS